MRTIKTIAVIIAFWGAIVSMHASNPKEERTNEMVQKTVDRISEITGLEPSQRNILTGKVKIHVARIEAINELKDQKQKVNELKKATTDFRTSLDSILTRAQKETLEVKRKAVQTAIFEKSKDLKRTEIN